MSSSVILGVPKNELNNINNRRELNNFMHQNYLNNYVKEKESNPEINDQNVAPRKKINEKYEINNIIPLNISEMSINNLENLTKTKNSIKFGVWFSIKHYSFQNCRQNGKKEKLLSFLQNYVNERLDTTFYLKTLEKFDIFRMLILNKTQNLCFQYLKKPDLNDEMDNKTYYQSQNIDKSHDINEIITYFNNRIRNKEMTELDDMLINMVYQQIKNLSIVD